MCGIAGLVLPPGKRDDATQTLVRTALRTLLTGIQYRGRDATGVLWAGTGGEFNLLKADTGVAQFLSSSPYTKWEESIPGTDPVVILGHTRMPTLGSVTVPVNNHPILCGSVAGVHNGMIVNHTEVAKKFKLKRDGVVDSEVIFRVMEQQIDAETGLLQVDQFVKDFKELRGQAAVAAVNLNEPDKLYLVKDGNPLAFSIHKELNLFAFSSLRTDLTEKYLGPGWKDFDMKAQHWAKITAGPLDPESSIGIECGACSLGTYNYTSAWNGWDSTEWRNRKGKGKVFYGYYCARVNHWVNYGDKEWKQEEAEEYEERRMGNGMGGAYD